MGREERKRAVLRRWPRHAWADDGLSRWRTWRARRYAYFLAVASLVAVCYLDLNLLAGRGKPWWPSSLLHQSRAGLTVLAVLLAANGLALVGYLSARGAPPGGRFPRSLAGLLLAPLPGLGLALLPAAAAGRPAPVRGEIRAEFQPRCDSHSPLARLFAACTAFLRSAARGGSRSLPVLIVWLVGFQVVPYLALLSWLVSASADSPAGRGLALALSAVLHVLLFVATRRHVAALARSATGGWMGLALRASPILLLLPAPAALLGIAGWLPWARENRDERTLGHAAFARRGRIEPRAWADGRSAVRPGLRGTGARTAPGGSATGARAAYKPLAAFRSMAGALRLLGEEFRSAPGGERLSAVWGRTRPEDSRRLAFYRLKTFLLALEAAAVSWALAWLRDGRAVLGIEDSSRALIPFAGLMALGAAVEAAFLLRRVVALVALRPQSGYLPAGRFLAAGQVSLLTGLLVGSALAASDLAAAGLVLMGAGLVTSVLLLLVMAPVSFLFALPGREVAAPLAWGTLLFEIFVVGAVLHYQPQDAVPLGRLIAGAVVAAPLLGLGLGLGCGRALIAPHSWRELSAHGTPRAARMHLALAAACAFLPLGGLVIPVWIAAERRLSNVPAPRTE